MQPTTARQCRSRPSADRRWPVLPELRGVPAGPRGYRYDGGPLGALAVMVRQYIARPSDARHRVDHLVVYRRAEGTEPEQGDRWPTRDPDRRRRGRYRHDV